MPISIMMSVIMASVIVLSVAAPLHSQTYYTRLIKNSTPFDSFTQGPTEGRNGAAIASDYQAEFPLSSFQPGCRGLSSNKFSTPIFETPGNTATACCTRERERERAICK